MEKKSKVGKDKDAISREFNEISDRIQKIAGVTPEETVPRISGVDCANFQYWNRLPIVTLHEAICLTLDGKPNDIFFLEAHKRRYSELERLVASHRVAGSLQFLNNNQIHAIDWLNWLSRVEIVPPKEWQPVGITDTVNEQSANGPCWEEAGRAIKEMRDKSDIGAPRNQEQLYRYMLETENKDRFPNCCMASTELFEWTSVKSRIWRERKEDSITDPLKEPRFLI